MSLLPWVVLLSFVAGCAIGFRFSLLWGIATFFVLWFTFGLILENPEEKEVASKMIDFSRGKISGEDLQLFLKEQNATIKDMSVGFRDFTVKKVRELGEEDANLFFNKLSFLTEKATLSELSSRQCNQLRLLIELGQIDSELELLINEQLVSEERIPKLFAIACLRYVEANQDSTV